MRQFLDDYAHAPEGTLAFYRDQVGRAFVSGMEELGITDLLQVTPDALRSYLAAESMKTYTRGSVTRPVSKTTVHLRQKAAGTFLSWCVEQNLIPTSPMRKVRSIPRPRPNRTAFTVDEVRRLLAEAPRGNWWLGKRDYALLRVLIDTGCRAAGLLNMTAESFDWKLGRVKLHEKGDKWRWVKVGPKTRAAVREYMEVRPVDSGFANLWLNAKSQPMDYGDLNWRLHSLGSYCSPPVTDCTAHRFRHYYAVDAYRKDHNIERLRINLGHEKIETTQQYLRSLGADYAMDDDYETPGERV